MPRRCEKNEAASNNPKIVMSDKQSEQKFPILNKHISVDLSLPKGTLEPTSSECSFN